MDVNGEPPLPTRAAALRAFIGVGLSSFGGPAAQIGLMHREYVERRRWLGEDEFLRALNLCMLLPGPEALQLAIYVGWRVHGLWGAVACGLCFVMPAVLLLLALSFVYVLFGTVPVIAAVLYGLEATVLALIGYALVRLSRRALDRPLAWAIAIGAFIALIAFGLPYPLVLGLAAASGAVGGEGAGRAGARGPAPGPPPPGTLARALSTAATGLGLWLLPLLLLIAGGADGRPMRLYLALSRAALLTFGGAYAIVNYVVTDFAGQRGWLTADQAIAGLALAETTPGPLLIVLQFFGFTAGWNDPTAPAPALTATLCALLASYAIFLPSFILVLIAAPHVGRLAAVPRLEAALRGVTAFVVGVIASLGLTVGLTVLGVGHGRTLHPTAIVIAATAAWLLSRPGLGVGWVLAFGALAGLASGAP